MANRRAHNSFSVQNNSGVRTRKKTFTMKKENSSGFALIRRNWFTRADATRPDDAFKTFSEIWLIGGKKRVSYSRDAQQRVTFFLLLLTKKKGDRSYRSRFVIYMRGYMRRHCGGILFNIYCVPEVVVNHVFWYFLFYQNSLLMHFLKEIRGFQVKLYRSKFHDFEWKSRSKYRVLDRSIDTFQRCSNLIISEISNSTVLFKCEICRVNKFFREI